VNFDPAAENQGILFEKKFCVAINKLLTSFFLSNAANKLLQQFKGRKRNISENNNKGKL